jgi:sterol desaturase/sphingolipid hydroxylase (fatty acid hydroxylase superfamily)
MEPLIRLSVFLVVFTTMILWELFRPRRPLPYPRRQRWRTNLGLTLLNAVLVRMTVGGAVYAAALFAAEREMGVLHWSTLPAWVAVVVTVVFNHGNVAIPESIDHWLRWAIVTPDMHRIHHSTREIETNSNFGFSVSWWDRLCGTYRAAPALGQTGMEIGLSDYRPPLNLGQLLLLPFQGDAGHTPFAGARPVQV